MEKFLVMSRVDNDPEAFYITGNTYPAKEKLKRVGGRWNPDVKGWRFLINQWNYLELIIQELNLDRFNDPNFPEMIVNRDMIYSKSLMGTEPKNINKEEGPGLPPVSNTPQKPLLLPTPNHNESTLFWTQMKPYAMAASKTTNVSPPPKEISTPIKVRKCGKCRQPGHDYRSCPLNSK